MSKDHSPGDFGRPSGYKSDLEVAETQSSTKSVNTSFGSKNHNAYIMRADGTHEHFFYSPKDGRSGWHGANYETRSNHPRLKTNEQPDKKGAKTMDKNSFVESLKVDKATVDRCNTVSQNHAKTVNTQSAKKSSIDDGGRDRGDSGPASLGREAGNKVGAPNSRSSSDGGHGTSSSNTTSHNSSAGQGSGGQGAGGHGSAGGHSGAGGGQGGHGGSGGGHGGH